MYKAQVRGTQEVVAVKVIPLGDKDEVLEIQKEIEMLKECNHTNVVRYLVRCPAIIADIHPSTPLSITLKVSSRFCVGYLTA